MYPELFEKLREHIGHKIACVCYGKDKEVWNVSIECETCSLVLVDADAPEVVEMKKNL